eukprot:1006454-Amphidinium_carterae.1
MLSAIIQYEEFCAIDALRYLVSAISCLWPLELQTRQNIARVNRGRQSLQLDLAPTPGQR